MNDVSQKKSFISKLWERRFFQFFATYIAASWGAIQFMEWGVKRYNIPSEWVDKLVVFLLMILPLVVSVIYFHGKAGDDKWLKFEKIFYPINLVGALLMSVLVIDGGARSTTEEVTYTDLEGQTVVREVPKSQYNRKIVVFPIDETALDPAWEGIAVSELMNNKLEQDMRIIVSSAMSVADDYEHYGYEKLSTIPFATKLNIAEQHYSDYFVDAAFSDESKKRIDLKIFETESGKEVKKASVEADDLYALTDSVAVVVFDQLDLEPLEGSTAYIDLPASNLITTNPEALESYIQSITAMEKSPSKVAESAQILQKSLDTDPTCAECWIRMSVLKMLSGQSQDKERANALKYADNLPERQQLNIKFYNYMASSEQEKGEKLCQMWRKLYPKDSKPVFLLNGLYNQTLNFDKAKATLKEAIDEGHKGSIYITYANLLIQGKDWEEAEVYLKKYKDEYPKQFQSTSLLVDVYAGKGEIEKAVDALDELLLLKPNESSYVFKQSQLLSKQNQFDKAISALEKNLKTSEVGRDSISNYSEQLKVYLRSMKFEEYAKVRRKLKKVFMRNFPAVQYLQTEYTSVGYYKEIGQADSINYHISNITNLLPPGQKMMVTGLNEFIIAFFKEDASSAETSYEKVKPMFEAMGSKMITLLYDSELAFMKGDYEAALPLFASLKQEAIDISMVSNNYHETHLKLGLHQEGLDLIETFLEEDPMHPMYNYYKAKFQNKLGKDAEAKKTLNQVLPIFKAADPRAEDVQMVLAFAKELSM